HQIGVGRLPAAAVEAGSRRGVLNPRPEHRESSVDIVEARLIDLRQRKAVLTHQVIANRLEGPLVKRLESLLVKRVIAFGALKCLEYLFDRGRFGQSLRLGSGKEPRDEF